LRAGQGHRLSDRPPEAAREGRLSELRRDPITGRWAIIAKERAARTSDFVTSTSRKADAFCPFCPGNEDATPHELLVYRASSPEEDPPWLVRAFPNRFP